MLSYTDELDFEKGFLDFIDKHTGMLAWHNLTSKEGYPDVTLVGRRIILLEFKMDRARGWSKLEDIMEPSQPVFMHDTRKVGFTDCYLVVLHEGLAHVFSTERILHKAMAGHRVDSLECLVSFDSFEPIVEYLQHIGGGNATADVQRKD